MLFVICQSFIACMHMDYAAYHYWIAKSNLFSLFSYLCADIFQTAERMSEGKDYTKRTFALAAMVIIGLTGLSFIPPFKVAGVSFKRANILSDIMTFGDEGRATLPTSESLLDTSFLEIFREAEIADSLRKSAAAAEEMPAPAVTTSAQSRSGETTPARLPDSLRFMHITRPVVETPDIVCIEDFSAGEVMMSRFYNSLAFQSERRPVRIAVLGDSFIEADIITADLREQLQMQYGGNGVGFVPFSTPLSKYRGTVKHTHDGWENHNVIKHKSVPEEYKPWFFVSGNISIPVEGATVEYKGVNFRNRIEESNTATLLFVNREGSVLDVTVNDSISNTYTPSAGNDVEAIRIAESGISKLNIKVRDAKGFIGYGVVLEDSVGVSVHNFSVRSNSGMALLATDQRINSQINEMMHYDLVILQYGLNAMSADVTDYKYYGNQLVRIIDYVKRCFPGSAVLVMSVGDRSSVKGGTANTMPAVHAMIETQKDAARRTGVGFWNTFEAMGGSNSMPTFVERKWASKDYTHISYPGGKFIAERLAAYLIAAAESIKEQEKESAGLTPELERQIAEPVPGRSIEIRMPDMTGAAAPGEENVLPGDTLPTRSDAVEGTKRHEIFEQPIRIDLPAGAEPVSPERTDSADRIVLPVADSIMVRMPSDATSTQQDSHPGSTEQSGSASGDTEHNGTNAR